MLRVTVTGARDARDAVRARWRRDERERTRGEALGRAAAVVERGSDVTCAR